LLREPTSQLQRRELYWHYPHYYTRMTPASAVRDGDWKLIHYYEDDRLELFNLAQDIGESQALQDKFPDKAEQLKSKLDSWRAAVGANAPTANVPQ
jgi:uncharacterized sulfatase